MKISRVCILGGTGFVGHHLSARLANRGIACRIVTRHPQRHRDLRVLPESELVQGNVRNPDDLKRHFEGCEAVINLVGILNEGGAKGAPGFREIHVELVEMIAEAGREAGVQRLLHMSALNASASKGPSEYLRTKGEGENQAHIRGHATMKVTSFRPSVIFGPGDGFFNRFATFVRMGAWMFPLACAGARFQPVYVGDVAEAFTRALTDRSTWDRHLNLCGPRVLTLREAVEYTARVLGRPVRVVELSETLSRWQARTMERLPGRPFTYDNYLSMQVDSVCQSNDLESLGIRPRDPDEIVPLYLAESSQRARYLQLRRLV